MTRDSKGRPIFRKGAAYTPLSMFSPVWRPGVAATCIEAASVRVFTEGKDEPEIIEGGKGLFTIGDDTRWWHASEQFASVEGDKRGPGRPRKDSTTGD